MPIPRNCSAHILAAVHCIPPSNHPQGGSNPCCMLLLQPVAVNASRPSLTPAALVDLLPHPPQHPPASSSSLPRVGSSRPWCSSPPGRTQAADTDAAAACPAPPPATPAAAAAVLGVAGSSRARARARWSCSWWRARLCSSSDSGAPTWGGGTGRGQAAVGGCGFESRAGAAAGGVHGC